MVVACTVFGNDGKKLRTIRNPTRKKRLAPALVSGTSPGALVCDLDPAVALTLLVRKNP